MSREHEDGPPNVEPPKLKPPPPDLAETLETLEPPPGPTTDIDPPLMTAAQGAELRQLIEALARAGAEREERIANRQVQAYNELQSYIDTKLEQQSEHFKTELQTAATMLEGLSHQAIDAVTDLGGKVAAGFDRVVDNIRTEFNAKLGIEGAGLRQVIASMPEFNAVRDTAKKALDTALDARREQGHDVDAWERPTLTEVPNKR